ncbi:MAG: tetratricopeptide repeat protein, partial [Weeksellaceae bacterium]|nr:tetratricopeptide repeat protein [Weeksellaceae bacterium]
EHSFPTRRSSDLEEALQNILKMQNPDSQGAINFKQKIFNNIAAIKIQQKEFDKALEYYQNSLKVNAKIGDKNIESSLNNNIGICYMEKKEYELAKYYLEKSLDIRRSTNDWMGVAQCYNNIGKNNALMGNFALAKENLLKALEIENKLGNKESKLVSLQSLTQLYKEIGDYKNAFQSLEDAEVVKDSLYNIESAKKIAQLELQHKIDKQKKVFNLELKRRETEEQKRRLIYLVIAITLVLVSVILGLLVYLQRTKINNTKLQRDKLELEHLNISLEKQKLTEELDFKNRELTTNVMYLLKKNELINGIAEKLIQSKNDFKSENRKVIQEIITQLKSSNDEKIWSEFETHFTKVHSDFYHKLNEKFPNLSTNEKKLCAFLRLNLSTKDISTITYQSVNSITVARSRLRKKLNIQGEDTNLINFLTKL